MRPQLDMLPDYVLKILAELKEEEAAESIWLVGSRANQTSTPHSDWDLLVFASVEPEVVPARCENVDVIRVGPSRQTFLLEGKGSDFKLSFVDWHWREVDETNAIYLGKRFIDYPPGARDANEPVFSQTEQPAYCIWSKRKAIS